MRIINRLTTLCLLLVPFIVLFGNSLPHRRAAMQFRHVVTQLARNSIGKREISEIGEACRMWPGNAYYHLTKALVYDRERLSVGNRQTRRSNYLQIASDELQTAIYLNPADPILYQNLGWVEFMRGNFSRSVEVFNKTLALDPSAAQAHLSLFLIHTALGHHRESATELAAAIRWSPSLADSAIIHTLREQCPLVYEVAAMSAIQTLELGLGNEDPVEQARLSKLYLLRGEITKAEVLARRSLEALPNLSRPWIVLGDVEGLRGDPEQRRRNYLRAAVVSQNATDAPAFLYLGDRSNAQGHWQDAAAFYQLALHRTRNLSSEHALYSRAVYKSAGAIANDLIPEQLLAWTAPAPDLKSLYSHLATCYRAMGKDRAAREYEELNKQPEQKPQLEGRPLLVCPGSVQKN